MSKNEQGGIRGEEQEFSTNTCRSSTLVTRVRGHVYGPLVSGCCGLDRHVPRVEAMVTGRDALMAPPPPPAGMGGRQKNEKQPFN